MVDPLWEPKRLWYKACSKNAHEYPVGSVMKAEPMAFFKLGSLSSTVVPAKLQALLSATYMLGAEKRYGVVPDWDDVDVGYRAYILYHLRKYPNAIKILKKEPDE